MTDIVVIGAGPAGVLAALRAAELGARTVLVTSGEFGGMAANDGPVPVRVLAHAARLIREARQLGQYGLTARGSGVDNVRNITASPTAGLDGSELFDTRPLAKALHHYMLNHRDLFGLPRKFNVAFDGPRACGPGGSGRQVKPSRR